MIRTNRHSPFRTDRNVSLRTQKTRKHWRNDMRLKLLTVTVLLACLMLPAAVFAQDDDEPDVTPVRITDYSPVTDKRLLEPEDENWLMYRRTYDAWGYS